MGGGLTRSPFRFSYFPLFFPTLFLGEVPFFGGEKAKSLVLQSMSRARNLLKFPSPFETLMSFLYCELNPSTAALQNVDEPPPFPIEEHQALRITHQLNTMSQTGQSD